MPMVLHINKTGIPIEAVNIPPIVIVHCCRSMALSNSMRLEKSFRPRKPKVAASRRHKKHEISKRYHIAGHHPKGERLNRNITDLFRVFRAFRGLTEVFRMSCKDNCRDNAASENCFHTLKTELILISTIKQKPRPNKIYLDILRCFTTVNDFIPPIAIGLRNTARICLTLHPKKCWHITRAQG